MKKYKAAIISEKPEIIDYVYTPEQLKEISTITDLYDGIFNKADILAGKLAGVEVVFSTWCIPPLDAEVLARMPELKAVFYGAGATDSFARPCFAAGITLCSAWQANAIPVAEFCLGQILLGLKGYFRYARTLNCREKFNQSMRGRGTYGETVVLIGDGAVANKLRELLGNFNLKVIMIPSRPEWRTVSLEEAFKTAFVISNHLPNRDDNIGVINRTHFESMRYGATFINTGRGAQVNEADMIEVFKARPDLTALLDVTFPEPPVVGSDLYNMPNIRLSSHIAGSLNNEVVRMSEYMLDEFKRFISGKELRYEVKEDMLITSKS